MNRLTPAQQHSGSQNFLIFALSRTGSTTLCKALNKHPDIVCANEPFNQESPLGRRSQPVHDLHSLKWRIVQLRQCFNGIKHVWDQDGWPFPGTHLNEALSSFPGQRVVFLRRRNILRRLVSVQLCAQANLWHFQTLADRDRFIRYPFTPLDINQLQRSLQNERRLLELYKSFIQRTTNSLIDISYEDLFGENSAIAVTALLEFIGHPGAVASVSAYIGSSELQVQCSACYTRVPELDTIDRLLGSDDTGWIFK